MSEVYVVDALRTPSGRFGGALKGKTAVDLGVAAVGAVLGHCRVDATAVEEVFLGIGWQAGAGPNPARVVTVKAGLPHSVPATSVNVRCGSSLKALMFGCQAILTGDRELVLVGGMESTSQVPYALPEARWGHTMGDKKAADLVHQDGFKCPLAGMLMGATADLLADKYSIPRAEQDEFALQSQSKAAKATAEGRFAAELIPMAIDSGTLTQDETCRPSTNLADLSKLPPVFSATGTVTAGNSCAMADGASAAVLASGEKVKTLGLTPVARVVSYAHVGVDPKYMGIGPAEAVPVALRRAGLTLDDIDIIEANEAFAAQVLACERELRWNRDIVNVHGGAIALGHPVGATGTKLLATLVQTLRLREKRYGLVTLCVGGGHGMAVVVERV